MHLETINSNMHLLTKKLGFLREFSFYLAGGTGLALQIGHRKSYDFDFFTDKEFSPDSLATVIKKSGFQIKGEMKSWGTLYCILEDIKVSFIFYDCLLLLPPISFESIIVADWRDITVEKLRTVSERGLKKDFYDLYFGIKKLGVDKLCEMAYKKYGRSVNYFHIIKGLTYFEEAEKNPEPILIDKTVSWDEVKKFFVSHFQDFENALIRYY